jgi:hypothetical protein
MLSYQVMSSVVSQQCGLPLTIRGLSEVTQWDFENGFYWFSHPARINKLLAHYELYRQIVGLPGDVFELGVYKGASLIRFATFRAILENDWSRRIVGFDAFGAFPSKNVAMPSDRSFIERFEAAGGDGLSIDEMKALIERKRFDNIELVAGDVFETVPHYLESWSATRIALLHLDMDVKEPTAFALSRLYDRVVPGGLVVIDDYPVVAGATDAVDEFCGARGLRLEKLSHYNVPTFFRKP